MIWLMQRERLAAFISPTENFLVGMGGFITAKNLMVFRLILKLMIMVLFDFGNLLVRHRFQNPETDANTVILSSNVQQLVSK